ncbi:hypothetical protein PsorP6_001530 [Peronosclerospora sorghi]|uniref:Uncharacterized protein n=1 Tax=Peronosclerospora sorghi TaxID=230839 RepID=A0ACC0WWQ8_9STRA|nr:hypothetical protein PsorP6_001530 [Peronosclerospora sorghi]
MLLGDANISLSASNGKRERFIMSLMCSSAIMDCSRDAIGYQIHGRIRSHESNVMGGLVVFVILSGVDGGFWRIYPLREIPDILVAPFLPLNGPIAFLRFPPQSLFERGYFSISKKNVLVLSTSRLGTTRFDATYPYFRVYSLTLGRSKESDNSGAARYIPMKVLTIFNGI